MDASIVPFNCHLVGSEVVELTVLFLVLFSVPPQILFPALFLVLCPAFSSDNVRQAGSSSESSPIGIVLFLCTVVDKNRNLMAQCPPELLVGDNKTTIFAYGIWLG